MDVANPDVPAARARDDADPADVYDEVPCGCLATGPDGRIVGVNRTFLDWTGHAREALVGAKRFSDLLTVPGKMFYSTQFAPLLQMQGAVREMALDLACPGRAPLSVLVNATVQTDAGGRPRLTRFAVCDATHWRR